MGNVTFLGVEGSGKSVLMTALVNAFKAHEHEGWFLRPDTRSAFRFLEQAPIYLNHQTAPHQTTSLKYLAWTILRDGEEIRQLDMLDYPGEIYRLAFLDAIDDLDPNTFLSKVNANKEEIEGLLLHLVSSSHVFVLFNLSDAIDLESNAKNLDAVWTTNACLDYLHRLPHKPKVTLLLTQIDRYVDLRTSRLDEAYYVQQHLPLIYRNFPNLEVIAVSAMGARNLTCGIEEILYACMPQVIPDSIPSINFRGILNEMSLLANRKGLLGKISYRKYCDLAISYLEVCYDQIETTRDQLKNLPWFAPPSMLVQITEKYSLLLSDALFGIHEVLEFMQRLKVTTKMRKRDIVDAFLRVKAESHFGRELRRIFIDKSRELS